jgi:hypothetical protein
MQLKDKNRDSQIPTIELGAVYRHYKGKLYKIVAIARDSEDPASLRVIYEALYECPTYGNNALWDRPYAMFVEEVVINGVSQPRFQRFYESAS